MDRQKHGWKITLHDDRGNVSTREVWAYWDPEQEGCAEAVAATARGEAHMASKKQHEYMPISVERIAEGVAS